VNHDPIAVWHRAVEAHDLSHIEDFLAEGAVFQSPAVHRPQQGKALTAKYLRAAMDVLNVDSFRYVGEWRGPGSAVLEFELNLGEIQINGVDIIAWDDHGLINRFKVMIRPLRALETIIPLMGARLALDGS
jgi:hypothetical protein